MARRATGNLRRVGLGSVVEGVLHGAPCPVLVVPEPTRS
jgi:nucleotide-binding universal stress UspA family protein